ncbi:hypothetical protein M1N22_04375 [Dehalococcoidia bacterium]|nr:hypothetical protein [Dehalococcoidia bacterium]MCL0056731.1 hypothetical protein [Dehalococcoidia bacterium]
MIKIVTKIMIRGKSPAQIADFLINLDQESYVRWHPAHQVYRYLKKTENGVGSIIRIEELLEDGVKIGYTSEVLEIKKSESKVTSLVKAKTLYPVRLFLSAEKIGEDTEVTHELRVGFSFYGLEKIFDWFVRKFIFTERKIKAIHRHATEEFKNLENII